MIEKGNDYSKSDGQTQGFRDHNKVGKENANGGKLQQRESDVRFIVDNQIAGTRFSRNPRRPAKK